MGGIVGEPMKQADTRIKREKRYYWGTSYRILKIGTLQKGPVALEIQVPK